MVIAALLAALATATPPPAPSPQEIFDKAFARLATYPIAPYAVEIVTRREQISSAQSGLSGRREFVVRYAFRSADGGENAASYPAAGSALPPALISKTPLGPFMWSIRRETGVTSTPNETVPEVPQPLKTIAHVTVYAPPAYAIDLSGVEPVDGHACYHLHLRPLSAPQRHNLRDLWIDTTTYDLWKARYDGDYRPDADTLASQTTFTTVFGAVGSYWIVSHQHWTWNDVRNSRLFDINIEINKIVFPETLPGYFFDRAEYDKQQNAGTPDPLDALLNGQ